MNNTTILFNEHKLWLDTAGRKGKQLTLENINMREVKNDYIAYLTESFLVECVFDDMRLSDIDFFASSMHSCSFKKCDFISSVFTKCDVSFSEFMLSEFKAVDMCKADFSNCDFSEAKFTNCKLINTGFFNVNLNESVFENVDFEGACWRDVSIKNTVFKNCNINKITIFTTDGSILQNETALAWLENSCKG